MGKSKTTTIKHVEIAKRSNAFPDEKGRFKTTERRRIVKTHHIEVAIPPLRGKFIEVHNRNTPLFDYRKAKNSINSDIRLLKKEIRHARLLKIQAYIAYRLTK